MLCCGVFRHVSLKRGHFSEHKQFLAPLTHSCSFGWLDEDKQESLPCLNYTFRPTVCSNHCCAEATLVRLQKYLGMVIKQENGSKAALYNLFQFLKLTSDLRFPLIMPVAVGSRLYADKKRLISSLFSDAERVFHSVEMQYGFSMSPPLIYWTFQYHLRFLQKQELAVEA